MATTQLRGILRQIEKLSAGHAERQRTDRQLLDAFAATGDEAAFAELVARHGPLVLRVCRRVLRQQQDAEDAYQATFLVLARSAASIRKREAVGDWLHGVAYRTAMKARRGAARRRNHEARSGERTPPAASPSWDDVQAVLDEEIRRLPEVFRSAFVQCVLEGKTVAAVAAEAGCKEGTVSSRLTRARQRLQTQLARRGIKLGVLLAALSLAESGRAAVPPMLAEAAVRFGLLVAAGVSAAGVIPARVADLATGVTRAMSLTKATIATAALLAVGLLAGALTCRAFAAREAEKPQAADKVSVPRAESPVVHVDAKPETPDDKDSIAYAGRVLGPDGRPVAGAKLYLTLARGAGGRPSPSPEYATTGPDGRFRFTAPRAKFGDDRTVVAATVVKHGPGWVEIPAGEKREDLTLRLVKDDVPITGRIVDLEGKPVEGASLTVLQINAANEEDLGPWLKATKDKKGDLLTLEQAHLPRYTVALSPKVTTDAEGRFRLNGMGRERLVRVLLEGPTLASQKLHILTRPGKPIEVTEHKGKPEYGEPRTVRIYYGADFRHVAAPTKPIVGIVRDKDTKKPLPGVMIYSYKMANNPIHFFDSQAIVRTTTDAKGRYRLVGMPKGEGNKIMVMPPDDVPYVPVHAEVRDTLGLEPVTLDFDLKRGVWIEGKITDKVTGKPVQGHVEYLSLYANPHLLRDYPGFVGTNNRIVTAKADGSYRIAGLPGPGLIGVYYYKDHYLRVSERDDDDAIKEARLETAPFHLFFPDNYFALARIDPAKGADKVKRDVTLDPGRTFTVKLVAPGGKPLTGARPFGQVDNLGKPEVMKSAEFTVRGGSRRRPGQVLFQHLEKGLVGVAKPPKEDGGTVTLELEPGAAVTGRLLDADGKPRAGVELNLRFARDKTAWHPYMAERVQTDREGRFRITALLPGQEFRLSDRRRVEGELSFGGLRPGETKDLGDVRLKKQRDEEDE